MIGRAFTYGIKRGSRYLRTVIFVYLIQFLLSAFVAIQFSQILQSAIGGTLGFKNLLKGYDHSIISDFRRVWQDSLNGLNNVLIVVVVVYLLLSVFLNGGMIASITSGQRTIKSFLRSGLKYYLPFLLVVFCSAALIIIWGAITLFPLTLLSEMMFEATITESQVFLSLMISGMLFTLGFALIFNWSVLSRVAYVLQEGHLFKCMGFALRDIFRTFPKGMALFLLFVIVQIALVFLYWGIEDILGMRSKVMVILFFLLQQVFVIARIFWRIMLYGSLQYLYRGPQSPMAPNSIPSE